ncbi:MAG: DnaB helicase C-terminal domain-containing protein [Chloroflexi bacterium]|nr:DnaB helicase C-terminal domain-containing protein [Chloroflexota bacterium]
MNRSDDGYETIIHFPGGTGPPVSLRSTVEAFERELVELDPAVLRPIPTGFPQLDVTTGGGLHAEDLVLVVGKQNVGKTLFVSQMARNIARWAALMRNRVVCVLICYEHSPVVLHQRLLCMESWLAGAPEGGVTLAEVREALADLAEGGKLEDVSSLLLKLPKPGLLGWRAMERYLDTLYLYRGDPVYTSPDAIDKAVVVLQRQGLHPVVIVDYAQRVPAPAELAGLGRDLHIDYVVRSLKALAMRRGIPVVAVAAVDEQAIRRRGPVHLEDLWGPVTMTYEPDGGWLINQEHLQPAGDDGKARTVRLAIEKNRHGPSEVEWRHHMYGERFHLQPEGSRVPLNESNQSERLGRTGAG